MTRISYSHDGSFIQIRKRVHSQQYIPYHKLIKILISKHKIVNLSLTLTDTGGAVLTLLLGHRSFIHLSEHRKRVYIELL